MRAVTGTVASWRRVSVLKAATIISRFAGAGAATGARTDVVAYLRRSSAGFDELARVHREIKARRRIPEVEIHGAGEGGEEMRKKKGRSIMRICEEEAHVKREKSDLEMKDRGFGVEGEALELRKKRKEGDFEKVGDEERKVLYEKINGVVDFEEVKKKVEVVEYDRLEEKESNSGQGELVMVLNGDGKKRKYLDAGGEEEVEPYYKKKKKKKRKIKEEALALALAGAYISFPKRAEIVFFNTRKSGKLKCSERVLL